MPNRQELAAYLANLITLMNAQESVGLTKAPWLVDEYHKTWDDLKSEVTEKDDPDETV